jgi:hypothetical protein
MAQRRMFSLKIVDTDAFLDMPPSSQLLYFQLSMRADDEGFVGNPRRIMRMIGSGDDDLKILLVKRFILAFDSGVVVIKHWFIHNYIQKDRCSETTYLEEKKSLSLKANKAYTEIDKNKRIENVSRMDTQYRLGKDSIGKDSKDKIATPPAVAVKDEINPLIELFKPVNPSYKRLYANTTQRVALARLVKEHGAEKVKEFINILPKTNTMPFSPTITTPLQLESKLGQLWAFCQKESLKINQNKIIKI